MTTATAATLPILRTTRLLPRWLDLPFIVTSLLFLARIPLVALSCFLILRPIGIAALAAVFFLIVLLDILDGIVFSRSRAAVHLPARRWRRVIDASADRMVVQAICLPAVLLSAISWPVYMLICIRELALICVVAPPALRHNHIFRPNLLSRLSSTAIPSLLLLDIAGSPLLPLAALLFLVCSAAGIREYRIAPNLLQ